MTQTRHLGMDWLRIGAFGLLILYHIGMYFVPWPWHVKIAAPIDWVAIPMLASNAWRLALLFLVSGYASAALFAKSGRAGLFLRSRSTRLLVPLAFAIIVVIPPQPWIELTVQNGYQSGFLAFWLQDYFSFARIEDIILPTWQHLWFVAYLWTYTAIAMLLVAVLPRRLATAGADLAAQLLGGERLLLLPLGAWLMILALFPEHESTHALVDDGPSHLHYMLAFAIGWLLRIRPQLFGSIASLWRPALGLAGATLLFVAAIEWNWPGRVGAPAVVAATFDIAHLAYGWATIIALVGIADRYWNVDHRWRSTLAEAVFPFYIIHQTIIVVAGWYLLRSAVGAPLSFAMLLTLTISGCWLFYAAGRRIGWLRPVIGLAPRG